MREKSYRTELESNRKFKWYPGEEDLKTNKKCKSGMVTKQAEDISQCKMSIPPDLVLGAAGMSDPHSLIVKVLGCSQSQVKGFLKNKIWI